MNPAGTPPPPRAPPARSAQRLNRGAILCLLGRAVPAAPSPRPAAAAPAGLSLRLPSRPGTPCGRRPARKVSPGAVRPPPCCRPRCALREGRGSLRAPRLPSAPRIATGERWMRLPAVINKLIKAGFWSFASCYLIRGFKIFRSGRGWGWGTSAGAGGTSGSWSAPGGK